MYKKSAHYRDGYISIYVTVCVLNLVTHTNKCSPNIPAVMQQPSSTYKKGADNPQNTTKIAAV